MQKVFLPHESQVGDNMQAWCRLIRDRRWSTSQKRELLNALNTPQAILAAPRQRVKELISGRLLPPGPKVSEERIHADVNWLADDAHHLIPIGSPSYPELLNELPDPALALFAIGDVSLLNRPQVAIVGSRKPTPVGDRVARMMSQGLAEVGIVITSGMALGVDGAAHEAALSSEGRSIAVLGNGLDTVYPAKHRALFEQLTSSDLVVSEFPLGVSPSRYTFPQRNRIISGLSYGVVVVEAAERSGTLITARLALEQNKEVMAVPGSALSSQYQGSHTLIQQGAALVSTPADVLNCLSGPLRRMLQDKVNAEQGSGCVVDDSLATSQQRTLLECISVESTPVDDIISMSQLTSAEVSSMLLELELMGVVAVAADGGYVNLS